MPARGPIRTMLNAIQVSTDLKAEVRKPDGLAVWRPGREIPPGPADQDGAATCTPARPGRRCKSSRRPIASTPATSGRRGTSSWARRPSRTTKGRSRARLQPAPAQPGPARNASPCTTSLSAHRGTRCNRRRCRDTQATTAGLPTARPAARGRPGHAILPFTSLRQHHRGVGLEDRRDGRGDDPADRCAVGDPRDFDVCPDRPRSAVSGQPYHASSVDVPAGCLHGLCGSEGPRP